MGGAICIKNPRVSVGQSISSIRRQQQQKQPMLWPIPKIEQNRDFVPNDRIDRKRYSLDENQFKMDLPLIPRQTRVTTIDNSYPQRRETNERRYVESNVYQSAHTQMTMHARTNLWAGASSSDEMRRIVDGLYIAHTESNEMLQIRLQGVSNEAKRVHHVIKKETDMELKRLLDYAQQMQAEIQQLHEEWLQKYIILLDQWQTRELAKLQEKLVVAEGSINEVFQEKLALVNQQVEEEKSRIFREEAERQAKETDEIFKTAAQLARENKASHIGTEVETDIHVKIQANAGNKEMVNPNRAYAESEFKILE